MKVVIEQNAKKFAIEVLNAEKEKEGDEMQIRLEDSFSEERDREKRRNNVIVYNMKESSLEDIHRRREEDCKSVDRLCSAANLKVKQNDIIQVDRIGKKWGKPRQTRVVFKDSKINTQLMINKSELKAAKNLNK